MFKKPLYFDYNSSTPVVKDSLKAMQPYWQQNFFNASAKYASVVKQNFTNAKASILKNLNALHNSKLVFYGGGTEACSSAIAGVAWYNYLNKTGKNHIIISAQEHDSGVNTTHHLQQFGFKVSYIKCTSTGAVDMQDLQNNITSNTCLISIMLVNNETGVINDIKSISQLAKQHNIVLHCDLIAAIGKLAINLADLGADIYSFAAHKFYGPKGIGANVISNNVNLLPMVLGSKQEYGLRAGTENITGAIGMAAALNWVTKNLNKIITHETTIRDHFEAQLQKHIKDYTINCQQLPRVCNTSSVAFANVNKNNVINQLANLNVCVAGGAASIFDDVSRVIQQLNLPPKYANGTVRFSFGAFSTIKEVNKLFGVLPKIVNV